MTPLLNAARRVGAPPTATRAKSRSGSKPRSFKINRMTLSSCEPKVVTPIFLPLRSATDFTSGVEKTRPIKRIDGAGQVNRVCTANRRGDNRRAADKAQWHLARDHRCGQNWTALNVNEINVEPVFFE